jgi:dihydroorotase
MPNLKPPVTTVAGRRLPRAHPGALPAGHRKFEPLMTLYLTDNTPPDEIAGADSGFVRRSSSTRPARRPTPTPA